MVVHSMDRLALNLDDLRRHGAGRDETRCAHLYAFTVYMRVDRDYGNFGGSGLQPLIQRVSDPLLAMRFSAV